jgi:hypothetical protein
VINSDPTDVTYDNTTTTHKVLLRKVSDGTIEETALTEQGLVGTKSVSETEIGDQKFLMWDEGEQKVVYRTVLTGDSGTSGDAPVTRFRRDEFTGDNSTTQFNLANPMEGVVYVEMNGLIQDLGDDYTIDTVNDRINFISAPPLNYDIVVFYYETTGIILPPPVGETNDGASLGTGEDVYKQKSGSTLQFRSLLAGNNVTLTTGVNDITIDVTIPAETVYTAGNGISKTGSQFSVTAGTGLQQETSGLSLNHLGIQIFPFLP